MGKTVLRHNGRARSITDFKLENGVAYGIVSGNKTAVVVGGYKYTDSKKATPNSTAKHALLAEHDKLFGDKALSPVEIMAYARSCRKPSAVKETHVERLENGRSIATGKVDGKEVSVMYEGKVKTPDGVTLDAKPWLKDVRKDLYSAANGANDQVGTTMADALEREFPTKVNAEFIRRLKSIGLVPAIDSDGNLCVTLGDDSIIIAAMNCETKRFNWLDQKEVCRNIDAAYKRKRESLQAYRKEVDAFFTRWIA